MAHSRRPSLPIAAASPAMRPNRPGLVILWAIFAIVLATLSTIPPAEAGWSTRRGGELGTLVTTTTAAGDELFVFCARGGLGFGLVPRLSPQPGGPGDLTQMPITVALDQAAPVGLVVEGFSGAWVAFDTAARGVATALPGATAVTVTIAPSHAEAFVAARQVHVPGGGFAAAIGKAGFPARCRVQ